MVKLNSETKIGVVGAGTMGTGIAQIAASNGNEVHLYDNEEGALDRARQHFSKIGSRLVEKGKLSKTEADEIFGRIKLSPFINIDDDCGLVIEAVVEKLDVKKDVFRKLENSFPENSIFATNTSSLSVTAVGSACRDSSRVIGTHFFNPAPLLHLVEIVPGLTTSAKVIEETKKIVEAWGKYAVLAKDTPGFIVNRVARPFYGEALRILDEGIAGVRDIDYAMKKMGGFKMGPFELMDLIGNDVNFAVTESMYNSFYNEPRYKPSFTQKRLVDANMLGKKTGRGFYDYSGDSTESDPRVNREKAQDIFERILFMLINEAADAVYYGIASVEDIDTAVTKGVNYPKGLLKWADEIGLKIIIDRIQSLYEYYQEERYRVSPMLKKMLSESRVFYE